MGTIFDFIQTGPEQTAGVINFMFWIVVAIAALGVFAFILFRVRQRQLHNFHVTIHKKVGNATVKEEDWAMKEYVDGNYLFHYMFLNKRSPIVDDEHLKIMTNFRFGIRLPFLKQSFLGFDAYMQDGKIMPMMTNQIMKDGQLVALSLNGLDYDAFNFMKNEVELYQNKKMKIDRLLQVAPYAIMVVVVMAFIVGTILSQQHLEKMAEIWLNAAKVTTDNIIDKIGQLQVIPQA